MTLKYIFKKNNKEMTKRIFITSCANSTNDNEKEKLSLKTIMKRIYFIERKAFCNHNKEHNKNGIQKTKIKSSYNKIYEVFRSI